MKTANINESSQILAISGVNEFLLAATQKRSGEIFERVGRHSLAHGEQIVGLCDALLREAGLALGELDAIAVDIGPGSFTGQRISLSFAKGLGLALGKPLIGLDSFSLWQPDQRAQEKPQDRAQNEPNQHKEPSGPVLIVIDGRKRRFYAQLRVAAASGHNSGQNQKNEMEAQAYSGNTPKPCQIIGTWDLSADRLYQMLRKQISKQIENPVQNQNPVQNTAQHSERPPLRLGGPGARLFQSELAKTEPPESCPVWQALKLPQNAPDMFRVLAQNMLHLAQKAQASGSYMKASDGPFYLRKSDAQEQREQKRAQNPARNKNCASPDIAARLDAHPKNR